MSHITDIVSPLPSQGKGSKSGKYHAVSQIVLKASKKNQQIVSFFTPHIHFLKTFLMVTEHCSADQTARAPPPSPEAFLEQEKRSCSWYFLDSRLPIFLHPCTFTSLIVEVDVLEISLREQLDLVDHIFIVEATVTHKGVGISCYS